MAIVKVTLEQVRNTKISPNDIDRVMAISDQDIDSQDIPLPSKHAKTVQLPFAVKPIKQQVTLRLDSDVLAWAKSKGEKGYQTRINDMLRALMMQEIG